MEIPEKVIGELASKMNRIFFKKKEQLALHISQLNSFITLKNSLI